jgi:hypothetical protein
MTVDLHAPLDEGAAKQASITKHLATTLKSADVEFASGRKGAFLARFGERTYAAAAARAFNALK